MSGVSDVYVAGLVFLRLRSGMVGNGNVSHHFILLVFPFKNLHRFTRYYR